MNIAPIQKEFAIMAAAGEGGSITPCGTVKVERGMSQTFVIQPEEGYVISDVLVNGQSVGAVAEYTFCDVNADANITAELMMSAIRCCELIRYANSSLPRRVEYLNEFLVKFDTLKLLIRVCRDRKLINIQTTADIIEMVTSVEKQILGWRNFTASQEEKAASVKPGSCSSR